MTTTAIKQTSQSEIALDEALERISDALRGLRFGAVEVQVHDSQIVRITRTERVRVERAPAAVSRAGKSAND